MKEIRVGLGERSYDINITTDMLNGFRKKLSVIIKGKKPFIITDLNVDQLYSGIIESLLKKDSMYAGKYVFHAGEEYKTLATVEAGYHAATKAGLDRNSVIVALGGGVCGDIAGFIAATYMRGIRFIQIPTTLLAMVDSSVGGKTGVDLKEGKNLIGAFSQPSAVFIDIKMLKTLPERELLCGLAEVIKYGMIADEEFFEYLENNIEGIKQRGTKTYEHIILRCCSIKADIVSKDEREDSLRAILNFGHTFGHAIETVSSYNKYQHGEAIAIGMLMACELGILLGSVDSAVKARLQKLIDNLSLPKKAYALNAKSVFDAMFKDKKTKDGKLNFIVPYKKIGQVKIVSGIDNILVLKAIEAYL